jgi:hypothetical protein
MEDVGLNTELSSHTTEAVVTTVGSGLSILLLDDEQPSLSSGSANRVSGLEYWKVCWKK